MNSNGHHDPALLHLMQHLQEETDAWEADRDNYEDGATRESRLEAAESVDEANASGDWYN